MKAPDPAEKTPFFALRQVQIIFCDPEQIIHSSEGTVTSFQSEASLRSSMRVII
ncbi:Unknown protein sequence [Pseudomonas syringae pv. cilantro]|uniref:Uncharacterized protein n=1 Tax=Pseudomonas syringae pv. cilantro TaxID=81035 RepID=A0A0N0XA42_PSESX|nr:Unknown protein sequence [Pseudomonas syringae pv. cilantro]